VQATIRIVLERAGHSVVVAGDGRNGLAIFEAGDFELLVLDIFMPGMDGLETMKLIHQRQPLIPILVISGRPISSDASDALDFLKMATKLGAISSLPRRSADQGPEKFRNGQAWSRLTMRAARSSRSGSDRPRSWPRASS
jgi:CheY-like chemotaxis protein